MERVASVVRKDSDAASFPIGDGLAVQRLGDFNVMQDGQLVSLGTYCSPMQEIRLSRTQMPELVLGVCFRYNAGIMSSLNVMVGYGPMWGSGVGLR